MELIRFRRLDSNYWPKRGLPPGIDYWEFAFNEAHLRQKLNGDMAEIIMPAKPWFVRLWRKFFPLNFVEMELSN